MSKEVEVVEGSLCEAVEKSEAEEEWGCWPSLCITLVPLRGVIFSRRFCQTQTVSGIYE